ncbi:hypothetical protein [Nocardia callitridis]|uniref:WXG100 family type VII secretion target n=1 Tax=Nocardia callitridis TaxID=648753 RepID=A0ABP9KXI2_9NOCA
MSWSVPADAPVQEYLKTGATGLLYFERFEVRYRRAFGDSPADVPSYAALHKQFYEQNGLNEDRIDDAAEKLDSALNEVGSQLDSQRGSVQAIAAAWQGQAADGALRMLTEQITRAADDKNAVTVVQQKLADARARLRAATKIKADVVLYILENGVDIKVDGKDADDIDNIISGRSFTFSGFTDGSLFVKLGKIFPDLHEGFHPMDMAGLGIQNDRYEERCQKWLDEVFKPDYEAKAHKFVDACKLADQGVKDAYGAIIDALDKVSEAPYPRPAGTTAPAPPGPATPGPATPGPATPGPATPGPSTVPAGTTPGPSTVPASTTTPSLPSVPGLDGLAALSQVGREAGTTLSGLGQSLSQGLSGVQSQIDGAIGKLTQDLSGKTEDKDGDGKPDEDKADPAAEFDIGGKHLKFEMGPDGQLKLVLSDADGKPQEFSVKLDENGKPVISTGEPEDDSEPATPEGAESTPEEGSTPPGNSAPQPPKGAEHTEPAAPSTPEPPSQNPQGVPTVPAPPTGRRDDEQDTGVADPAPNASEPPPAPDGGARLAEAGPL